MAGPKTTKLGIREDRPTALSSSALGSNLDAIGFNLSFLAARNPKLAVKILKLYAESQQTQESDPPAPGEDFALFAEELRKIYASNSD